MNKLLEAGYIVVIFLYGSIGFSLYQERGRGIVTVENVLFPLLFFGAVVLLGFIHYKADTSPQISSKGENTLFLVVSVINLVLSLAVAFLYLFGANHGDLVAFGMGIIMIFTLLISIILGLRTV